MEENKNLAVFGSIKPWNKVYLLYLFEKRNVHNVWSKKTVLKIFSRAELHFHHQNNIFQGFADLCISKNVNKTKGTLVQEHRLENTSPLECNIITLFEINIIPSKTWTWFSAEPRCLLYGSGLGVFRVSAEQGLILRQRTV